MSFTCSNNCECANKPENWNHCSKCDKMNCDLGDNSEEGWTYNDDTEKWCCPDCSEEEDDDDAKSANSSTYGEGCRRICRMCKEECSCWNYNDDHEVVCEDCEEDDDSHSTTSTICDDCMGPCAGLGRIYKNDEVLCENCYEKQKGHICHDCDAVTTEGRWDDVEAEDRAWYCADCVKKHDDAAIRELEEIADRPADGKCDKCGNMLHGGDNNMCGKEHGDYHYLCDMCYDEEED